MTIDVVVVDDVKGWPRRSSGSHFQFFRRESRQPGSTPLHLDDAQTARETYLL